MGLNHIKLPSLLIAGLYKNTLVEIKQTLSELQPEKPTKAPVPASSLWKFLGDNKKNILIVTRAKEAIHLPDNELAFLTGILVACKLSLADVAILNLHNHPEASYKELRSFFQSKLIFLFDIQPTAFGLPVNFPHYQVQAFSNTSFLYSPSLKELENDKLQKSKLWVCLRRLFNV